jgi:hypothetical protein
LAHHYQKKLWRLPKIERLKLEGSILKYRVLPFMPTYIGERRTTFAKAYRIKVRCYWEFFGEHVKKLENSFGLTPPHPHASHPPLKKGRPLHSMT